VKRPPEPPDTEAVLHRLVRDAPEKVLSILARPSGGPTDTYLPWDKIRFKTPPPGFTHEEWWAVIKLSRRQMRRELPLTDVAGDPFTFALPDVTLKSLEEVNRDASGQIAAGEQVTNPATRDRYLINSLIEEAINSSQLEGASTTRQVAKAMIRDGRRPRTRDERMIANNYSAMRMIGDLRKERLTPELICEIHRVVTDGTLDNPESSGRFQLPTEERVSVTADTGLLLHTPPPAEILPERIDRLCAFANAEIDDGYIPPVLRAITIHFMIGYDHPFEDGNGRTARALFYWSMLNQGYWLTEYVAISAILKNAPAKYARSYLYTEDDDNDLTYFHLYQLSVLQRSIVELHHYLAEKTQEVRELQKKISGAADFNHRQIALLNYAMKHPDATVTARSHMSSHSVVYETARQDLIGLEKRGLLDRTTVGRTFAWSPTADLEDKIRDLDVPRPAPPR
jgi:Fic family protein